MKEYFTHDYRARADRKMVNLQIAHGMEGVGIFWSIVEMLYEEDGRLPKEYQRIAYELRTDESTVKSVVEDFELFRSDESTFWSESALARLNRRKEISEKARESINKRWEQEKEKYERITNECETGYEGNTIKEKESKVNQSKVNQSKETDAFFSSSNFKNARDEWEQYLAGAGIHLKDETRKKQMNDLAEYSEGNERKAVQIIHYSIYNKLFGFVKPKFEREYDTGENLSLKHE